MQEDTNDLYLEIIMLLHNQLNELEESKKVFKIYSEDLDVVLRNKEELIRKLEVKNRNLRGEVESLNSEFLGKKQSPVSKTNTNTFLHYNV